MTPIRRYRGRRNTYTGAWGDELMAKLAEALVDDEEARNAAAADRENRMGEGNRDE